MQRKRNKNENTIYNVYKGILYPNKEQKILIAKTLGCCRFVYNRFLDERITEYKNNGKSLSYVDQCKELPVLKNDPETEWIKEVDSTALQNSVRNLQDAYDNFFRGLKEKRTGLNLGKNGNTHAQKGHEMVTYIRKKILTQPSLSKSDRKIATKLVKSLLKAIGE